MKVGPGVTSSAIGAISILLATLAIFRSHLTNNFVKSVVVGACGSGAPSLLILIGIVAGWTAFKTPGESRKLAWFGIVLTVLAIPIYILAIYSLRTGHPN